MQSSTISYEKLADNINKIIEPYVSFKLIRDIESDNNGSYKVQDNTTRKIRSVKKLSTGEKNIIAFLYFIEKLNEIEDNSNQRQKIIVFDDPMNSNDDEMQYIIYDKLCTLNNSIKVSEHGSSVNKCLFVMTHNIHFFLMLSSGLFYREKKPNLYIIHKKGDDAEIKKVRGEGDTDGIRFIMV